MEGMRAFFFCGVIEITCINKSLGDMGGKFLRGKMFGLPMSTSLEIWRKPIPIGKTLSLLSKDATS